MFIDDEFWSRFGLDRGPEGALLWVVAPVLLVFVLPALILLGYTVAEWVRLGPDERRRRDATAAGRAGPDRRAADGVRPAGHSALVRQALVAERARGGERPDPMRARGGRRSARQHDAGADGCGEASRRGHRTTP